MQLGNPVLRRLNNKNTVASDAARTATFAGIYSKAAVFTILTIIAAVLTEFLIVWSIGKGIGSEVISGVAIAAAVSAIPLVIIALIIAFVPATAKVLGFFYAVIEGAVLGLVSLCVDLILPGVAASAFIGTMLVLLASLIVNYVFKARISGAFVRGLMAATIVFVIVQLAMWLVTLFIPELGGVYFWVEFGVCALCVVWATVMIFWDLANIDNLVQTGAEKKLEWYAAFSLLTTLIYMYIVILELILRIVMLFKKD